MFAESLLNRKMVVARGGAAAVIKTATTSGRRQVVDVLTLAFATDPAVRWMYPNSQQYLEYFPNFVRLFGGRAFETETAYYVDSFSAAALWLPPGAGPDEDSLAALFRNTVDKRLQDDLFRVFEQMGSFHPKEAHWYLPLIGVDPVRQSKGSARRCCGTRSRAATARASPLTSNRRTRATCRFTSDTVSRSSGSSRPDRRRRSFR